MKPTTNFIAGSAAVLLPCALALAQAPAQDPAQEPAPRSKGSTFESLDADGDGRISKAEAEANAEVKAQFATYDLNGDGFIERAEVNQANGAQPAPTQSPRQ